MLYIFLILPLLLFTHWGCFAVSCQDLELTAVEIVCMLSENKVTRWHLACGAQSVKKYIWKTQRQKVSF